MAMGMGISMGMWMRDKKIAIILQSLAKTGTERVGVRLANYMADVLSLNVSIIVFESAYNPYIASPKVIIRDLNIPEGKNTVARIVMLLKRKKALQKCFQQGHFDQIISFQEILNFPAILTGFPVVVASMSPPSVCGKKLQKLFFLYKRKNVQRIIMQSNTMQNDFAKRGIHNTQVIRNSFGMFEKERLSSENNLAQKFKQPYFLAVGSYVPYKNFTLLINAFSKTHCQKNFSLLIAGDGPERFALSQLIEKLNLSDKVKLLGVQDDDSLDCLYRHAYATVLSSIFDAYPLVLIESLSKGTPIIATDCPDGPREIIIHEQNGFLVAPQHELAMRDALDVFAADSSLRQKCADYAAESVAHLTMDKIVTQWTDLCNSGDLCLTENPF